METGKNEYLCKLFKGRNIEHNPVLNWFIFLYLKDLFLIVGAQKYLRVLRTISTKRAKTDADLVNKMQNDLTTFCRW